MSFESLVAEAQLGLKWSELSPLPDSLGRAGMFAGVSNGRLFCVGGANFPDKYPWEEGKKVWYDDIFMLDDGGEWQLLHVKLPTRLAYGVSVSHGNRVILIGGSDEAVHYNRTLALEWDGISLSVTELPELPHPLANMAGALVGDMVIVAGGMPSPTSEATNGCYLLDLRQLESGWVKLPPIPGGERVFPVAASNGKAFFLFSGENTKRNAIGLEQRHILQDAYRFDLNNEPGHVRGQWCRLADIPRGLSAAASPAPFLEPGYFVLWGGVDRVTALHTDPVSHPGIPDVLLTYYPDRDRWESAPGNSPVVGRVTLPTVYYNGFTYYVNGEVKPGIRTNRLVGIASADDELEKEIIN